MARRSSVQSGVNWRLLANIAGGAMIVGLTLMLAPMVVCSFVDFAGLETPAGDAQAVRATSGFFERIGSGVKACAERNSPMGAPIWQQLVVVLGLVGVGLFTALGRVEYGRQLRVASAKHRQARRSLRKERESRPSGSAGFQAVPRGVSTGAAAVADLSGISGLGGSLDDPLAALDAEREKSGPRPSASESGPRRNDTSGNLPSLESLTQNGDNWEMETDGWESFPSEPFLSGTHSAAHSAAHAAATSASNAAAQSSPRGAIMATPAGGVSPTAATMPVQDAPPEIAALADSVLGRSAPSAGRASNEPSTSSLGHRAPQTSDEPAEFAGPVRVGEPFELIVRDPAFTRAPNDVRLALTIEALSGESAPAWGMARTLVSAGTMTRDGGALRVAISWREVADRVAKMSRNEGDGAVRVLASITADGRSTRVSAPIVDRLVVDITTKDGRPIRPRTVRVTSAAGRPVRGWIGAERPGRLVVDDLEPGSAAITFDDGSFVGHAGGSTRRTVHLATSGVAFPDEPDAVHALWLAEPRVLYAAPGASAATATGDHDAPFASIGDALDLVRERRSANDPSFAAVEIRLAPTVVRPSKRFGLVDDDDTAWLTWWAGGAVKTDRSWARDAARAALDAEARTLEPNGFAEDVVLDGLDDIRIVNTGYALALDRIAQSPGFANSLDVELADIPLALVDAPTEGPTRPARLSVENCSRVHIEGVQLRGAVGQSGLVVRDSHGVTARRCWVHLFASGPVGQTRAHGVGRGVQIDTSGGRTPDTSVVLESCDIGWNEAARKAVAVRGGGVSAFESNVEIVRCHVHHNSATADPPDVFVSGKSQLRGQANHRDGNRVAAS